MIRALVVLWTALILSTGCQRHLLPTATIDVDGKSMLVELAYKGDTRARGLMYRDALPKNEGMLFIYPDVKPRSFWMKNTRIPLSIAFIDANGYILKIADMKPLSLKHTRCDKDVSYALEVNQGWFKANGVTVDDRITQIPRDLEVQ